MIPELFKVFSPPFYDGSGNRFYRHWCSIQFNLCHAVASSSAAFFSFSLAERPGALACPTGVPGDDVPVSRDLLAIGRGRDAILRTAMWALLHLVAFLAIGIGEIWGSMCS